MRKTRDQSPDDKESLKLSLLSLERRNIPSSRESRKIGWYGKRLKVIRDYYEMTTDELVFLLDLKTIVDASKRTLVSWEKNHIKPSDKEIDKLCFIFEVPKEFFINDEITIKITEQLKIEICDHK